MSGNTAYVTSRITSSGGPDPALRNYVPGNYIFTVVQDNGEGTEDRLQSSYGLSTYPGCGPNEAVNRVFPVVEGNFRVFDAP